MAKDEDGRADAFVTRVQPFVESHSLAGAVMLVAGKDRTLAIRTVGFADIAANVPMRPDDLFWIASETKPITATALMMLVDEGKIHLDDPVAKYLPEFYNMWVKADQIGDRLELRRPQHPITIREILSHSSGMPFMSAMEQPTLDVLPLRDSVRSYTLTPMESEPGTRYQYSNAGVNTAGRIIEVVSGMPYEQFLSERLFKPLGMKNTTFRPTARQIARLAKSYKPNDAKTNLVETTITQLKYPLDDPGRHPFPAGGLFSTASDLAKFGRMMLNRGMLDGRRYVSEAAVQEMTRKQTPANIPDSYGLCWGTFGGAFGHGGAYATNLEIDPNRGLVLIWMVQHAGFANNGEKAYEAFKEAAIAKFGGPAK